jgi:hypothetical protein
MKNIKKLLSFADVANELGLKPSDVRTLIVEERRIPSIVVTLVGHQSPYNLQILDFDEDGKAFDLTQGFENKAHVAYLRVERNVLDKFIAETYGGKKTSESTALSQRERNTYLNIIYGLVDIIKNDVEDMDYQSKIIDDLVQNHIGIEGISKSNLEKVFALAKKNYENK